MSEKTFEKSNMSFGELTGMLFTDMNSLEQEANDSTDPNRRRAVISVMSVAGSIAAEENPYRTAEVKADPKAGYTEGKLLDRIKNMDKHQLIGLLRDTTFAYRSDHPRGPNITHYVVKAVGGKVIDNKHYFPDGGDATS